MRVHATVHEKSMDDILTSIRKTITEGMDDRRNSPQSLTDTRHDIIELTQMVQEDGSIIDLNTYNKGGFSMGEQQTRLETHLQETDQVTAPSPEEETASSPLKEENEAPSSMGSVPRSPLPLSDSSDGSLISQKTAQESMEAFSKLTEIAQNKRSTSPLPPEPTMLGDKTLEALMRETLAPLLKNWLDANLPSLVKWIVTEEIQKILKGSEKE